MNILHVTIMEIQDESWDLANIYTCEVMSVYILSRELGF